MSASARFAVVGAGGHAKVVISTLQALGHWVAAVFDDDPGKWGSDVLGVRVAGPVAALEPPAYDFGVVAVGDNRVRRRLAGSLGLRWTPLVHPAAVVPSSVRLGPGTVVFAGAVIQPGAVVGDQVIINTGASVDHDCRVDDFAHLAPGVRLAGGVHVGEGALLGVGSVAIPGVTVGDWATVGAGGVVTRDLADGVVAVGVPARPRRRSPASAQQRSGV